MCDGSADAALGGLISVCKQACRDPTTRKRIERDFGRAPLQALRGARGALPVRNSPGPGAVASGDFGAGDDGHLANQFLSEKDVEAKLAQIAEALFADAIDRLKLSDRTVDIRRWGLLGEQARAIVRQPDRTGVALPLVNSSTWVSRLCESYE